MSRYEITPKDADKYVIIVGWEGRLQTYFAQVINKEREWDMSLWKGTNPREINSVQELQSAINKYAEIPREVQNALAYDMAPYEYPEAGRGSGYER